jgi:mRNA-degrading endonuclease RelE of RelBE toxin-antitoxin system
LRSGIEARSSFLLFFPPIFFGTSVFLLKNARQDWTRADRSHRTMMVAKNSEELRLFFNERRHDAALQEREHC